MKSHLHNSFIRQFISLLLFVFTSFLFSGTSIIQSSLAQDSQKSGQLAEILGKVTQSDKLTLVQGALVSVTDSKGTVRIVETAPNGSYTIGNLIPQKYQIIVSADGYVETKKEIKLLPKQSANVDFALSKWGSIGGGIFKGDKVTPVGDVLILAKSVAGKMATAKTDRNGKFKIERVSDGTYTITVIHDKYSFPKEKVVIRNGLDVVGLKLTAFQGSIYGAIKVASTTLPIPNAKIVVKRKDIQFDQIGKPIKVFGFSKADGSYKIDGLETGKYHLQVVAKGYGIKAEDILLGNEQVRIEKDFNMLSEGSISGRIKGKKTGETVEINIVDTSRNLLEIADVTVYPDGRYFVSGLSSGIYTVLAMWNDSFVLHPNVSVLVGKVTSGIDLQLTNK
jgi:hypothetical protein